MDNDNEIAIGLASAQYAYLIASAGCGKTELIAKAVAHSADRRQLILTHTHAGVHSLRNRLRKKGVPPHKFHVDTIAAWALRWAIAYPQISQLQNPMPKSDEWPSVYSACLDMLGNPRLQEVIAASYGGMFVDEYQDCTLSQHQLVMKLAAVLPCRILGDPMQGIFDFGKEELVDIEQAMPPNFVRLPDPNIPWRWVNTNKRLGEWLCGVRLSLIRDGVVDLRNSPLDWRPLGSDKKSQIEAQTRSCFDVRNRHQGSIVAIHSLPNFCHDTASRLSGIYTSIDEIEAKDLMRYSEKLQCTQGVSRAIMVIEFAGKCRTKVSSELRGVREKFDRGQLPNINRLKKNTDVIQALINVATNDDLGPVLDALECIEGMVGILFRQELWTEMKRALRAFYSGHFETLRDAAWCVRQQTRVMGRALGQSIVSRTWLVKGLEFDHSILLNADLLDAKNLYVAMTRGSRSLTVLSNARIVPAT